MVLPALFGVCESLIWKAFLAPTFLLSPSFFWHVLLSVFAIHLPHRLCSIWRCWTMTEMSCGRRCNAWWCRPEEFPLWVIALACPPAQHSGRICSWRNKRCSGHRRTRLHHPAGCSCPRHSCCTHFEWGYWLVFSGLVSFGEENRLVCVRWAARLWYWCLISPF